MDVPTIIPAMDNLHIDPCLPSAWTEGKMTRQYRGTTCDIVTKNPTGILKGQVTVKFDGKNLLGNFIAPQDNGKGHNVLVSVSQA